MSEIPTVLTVDDDSIHQTVTEAMVKKAGYPVLKAYDGVQALDVFDEHEHNIGCILLDIQMPNMNGIEFLRHLRDRQKSVEVIIVSGYLDESNREKLDPLSPREYLKKPVSFDVLVAKLHDCLGDAGTSSIHEAGK